MVLDASAGTGKTFSIEHMVVRFVLEGIPIEKILAVTFTKKAAGDMKERVRSSMHKACKLLCDRCISNIDYLNAIIEDVYAIPVAIGRLKKAISSFDDASIGTIHSFCSRIIRENAFECGISLDMSDDDVISPSEHAKHIVMDFLRCGVNMPAYSPKQVASAMKQYKGVSKLIKTIVKHIDSGKAFTHYSNFDELSIIFNEHIEALRRNYASYALVDDFVERMSLYAKGRYTDTPAQQIIEAAVAIESILKGKTGRLVAFESFLQPNIDDFLRLIDEVNLKKNKKDSPPSIYREMRERLLPIYEEATNPNKIMLRMCSDASSMVIDALEDNDITSFDSIVSIMDVASKNEYFAEAVSSRYNVVILD